MFESKFVKETISGVINKGLHAFHGIVNTEFGKIGNVLLNIESRINLQEKNIEDLENRLTLARADLSALRDESDEYHKILNKLKRINLRI